MADLQKRPEQPVATPSFETEPWIAAERTIEEPRRAPEPPLHLASDEHVIELAEGDSIRLAR